MIDPESIVVGEHVWYGVARPRKVTIIDKPYKDGARWRVPVKFMTGETDDVVLSLIRVFKKRPSARRKVALKGIVDCYNELLPVEEQVSPELLEDKMRRLGIR
jgi:alpha-beta hydrolase superfamily lysophospholipase